MSDQPPNQGVPHSTEHFRRFLEEHLDLIERLVRKVGRRSLPEQDRDDFASEVKIKLMNNDYEVLRQFRGRSTPEAFLRVVIARALSDWLNRTWGRYRPSTTARQLGPVAVEFERLTVRDGLTFEEACGCLESDSRYAATRTELEQLAGELPRRARRRLITVDGLENFPGSASALETADHEARRQEAALITRIWTRTIESWSKRDLLVMKMHFWDGMKLAEVSRTLKYPYKALYRRFNRCKQDLARALRTEGVTGASIEEMLADRSIWLSLPLDTSES